MRKTVDDINNKRLYENASSAELQNSLDRIQRKTMKDTTERFKGLIFASASVNATIKRLDGLLKRKLRKLVTNCANM